MAPRGHIHQPLRSGSGFLGASIRPASGPSLLSLLFVSSSRPRFLCCSTWLPAPVDIHPPTFSHGPPLLTDFRSPPSHLPDSSLPSCPSFLCHAVRAALLPHPVTAVPSEIPPGLAGGRAGRLGCWCAVRGANKWCKFYDSSLLPTASDQFCAEDLETGSLTISAPPPTAMRI